MIYQRVIGTVFKLDTEEKLVWIDGNNYNYASDAESSLMAAIENDLMISALLYFEHCESGCRLIRAQILEDDQDTDNTPTATVAEEG
jgi:hypothetical protein